MKLSTLCATATLLAFGWFQAAFGQDSPNVSVKFPYNLATNSLLIEPAASYTIPGSVSGFSFIDLFEGGYFSQTDLTRPFQNSPFGIRSRTVQDNELHSGTGLGINWSGSIADVVSLSASVLPFWTGNEDYAGRKTLDYYFEVPLRYGFFLSGFGEVEQSDGELKFKYREFDFGKSFGPVAISYSPALTDEYEHRFAVRLVLQ